MLSNGRPLPSRPTSFRVVSMLMIMVTIQRSPRATPFFRIASKNIEIPMILSSMKKILKAQNRRVIEFYAPFISTRGGQSWLKPVISRARITRNDRPGWLPLTGRAPARFYAFHLPNYVGQCGGRGGVFIVSFTISPLFDRTNERGPCPPPLVRSFVGRETLIQRDRTLRNVAFFERMDSLACLSRIGR